MNRIKEALKGVGLNEKEITVYTSLLQLGTATAYKIAQKSSLKRPTVYVVLDELRLKGLVLKIPYSKKQMYSAKSPVELIADSEDNLRKIKSVVPELIAITQDSSKPSVSYYDKVDGIKELLNFGLDKLENSEIVGFNAQTKDVKEEMLDIFDQYNQKLMKKKIKVRGIVPDHPSLKIYREKDKEYGRNMKLVSPDKYSSDVSIDIGPDFIKILMFKDLQGVVIENKNLASAMKQIFEMQWDNL